ncbi:MAG TPA: TolC family protein [Polyangia bacterium]|jgi:outer membrane protein TolC|nr:TolC family protein [Polyangia bacterium]
MPVVTACRKRLGKTAAAAVALLIVTTVATAGAQTRLTADEVAHRAVATSATLAARRADVDAAAAAVSEARATLLPRVVGTARYARLSPITAPSVGNIVVTPDPGEISQQNFPVSVAVRFPVLLDQYVLQAGASVPLSDYLLRFPHTTTAAAEGASAARANQRAAAARIAGDARALYYEWARARLQRDVAVSAREQTRAHLEYVKSRRDAGGSTVADVLRVESQLAAADLLALRTENLAGLLEDQLRTVLHDPGKQPYTVGDDLDAATPAAPTSGDAATSRALEERAELAALAHMSAVDRALGHATRALVLPRLELYGGILSANPNPRFFPQQDRFHTTWEAGVSLTFSPNDVVAGLAVARRQRARAAATDAERQTLAEAIRAEVLAAARAQQESAGAMATTARGLAAAEESYRVRRALFTEGRATSVELTDAETDLVRARLAAIDARIDAGLARVRLQKAGGESP